MRCYYCGEEVMEGDLFCGNCGQPITAAEKGKQHYFADNEKEKQPYSADKEKEKPSSSADKEREKPRKNAAKVRIRILTAANLLMLALNLAVFGRFILPKILQRQQNTAAENDNSVQELTGETADDGSGQNFTDGAAGDSQDTTYQYEGTLMERDGSYYLALKNPIHAKFHSDGSETEITELFLEPGAYDLSKYQWQIISVKGTLSYSQGTLSLAIADSGLSAGGVTISADGGEQGMDTEGTPAAQEESADSENVSASQENQEADSDAGHLHPYVTNTSVDDDEEAYLQEISFGDEEAAQYPELAAALKSHAEELRQNVESYHTATDVLRADESVFSISETRMSYLHFGGAHVYYDFYGFNYDVNTGELLSLEDVVTDTGLLADIMIEKLEEKYELSSWYTESSDNYLHDYLAGGGDGQWTLGSDGIYWIFWDNGPFPHSAGMISVSVAFSDYPDLFREEYSAVPENWASPRWVNHDLDGDGTSDTLEVSTEWEEGNYEHITAWTITVNGNEQRFETDAYDYDTYLVKSGSQYCLYIFAEAEDGSEFLEVYGFSGGAAVRAGESYTFTLTQTNRSAEGETDTYVTSSVFTDPFHMELQTTGDDDDGVTAIYQMGADGVPEIAE